MNEHEYVITTFHQSFGELVDRDIILYGVGTNTKTIIDAFKRHSILGILDGFRDNGQLYGKSILSLSQAASLKPYCIIIVARANSAKIIARRISAFCTENSIKLYDIHGKDMLASATRRNVEHPYFSISMVEAKQAIDAHEVVSFDIFDTLLMRLTLSSADVFAILERRTGLCGLQKHRIQVERYFYNKGQLPTLKMIYDSLAKVMGLMPEEADKLRSLELAVEDEVLLPRQDVVELLRYAKSQKKRVYLVSEMYLTKPELKKILMAKGIVEYDDIFVSVDYSTNKTTGLYDVFTTQVGGESFLHFGDNEDADITFAKLQGLDSFQLMSAGDMMDISAWHDISDMAKTLDERLLIGMVIARVFNSPFSLYNSAGIPSVAGAKSFGYGLVAPLLTAFFLWLLSKIEGRFDRILWGARDGYLFSAMHRILREKFPDSQTPVGDYFYTSRMAAIAASITNEQDIEYAAGIGFSGTPAEMLQKRFFLAEADIFPYADGEDLIDYVMRHKEKIFARSAELRQRYLRYIKSSGINQRERLAFFDLVSSGTCQMCLESIMEQPLSGFYFIFCREEYGKKKKLLRESFVESGLLYELKSYLSTNYEPIENIVMPPEATLLSFDEDGQPVFAVDKRQKKELEYVAAAQKEILAFWEKFISVAGYNHCEVSSAFADNMYSLLRANRTKVTDCVFAETVFQDDFCNREFVMDDMFD